MLIFQNGDRLFIGAPGSWYWQGKNVYSHFTFIDSNNKRIPNGDQCQRAVIVSCSLNQENNFVKLISSEKWSAMQLNEILYELKYFRYRDT